MKRKLCSRMTDWLFITMERRSKYSFIHWSSKTVFTYGHVSHYSFHHNPLWPWIYNLKWWTNYHFILGLIIQRSAQMTTNLTYIAIHRKSQIAHVINKLTICDFIHTFDTFKHVYWLLFINSKQTEETNKSHIFNLMSHISTKQWTHMGLYICVPIISIEFTNM